MFKIINRDTGQRASISTFLDYQSAFDQIVAWKRRQEQGGRPDVSRETLDRLTIRVEDEYHD